MKHLAKRTLSLLLAALMVLSLIPAHTHVHAADVTTAYYGTDNTKDPNLQLKDQYGTVKGNWLTSHAAWAVMNGGVSFALSNEFLSGFNGKATVEVEYLSANTFSSDFELQYFAADGTPKPATKVDTTSGTTQGTGNQAANIAVYELTDMATATGTINNDLAGSVAVINTSTSKYVGIRSIRVTKVAEAPAYAPEFNNADFGGYVFDQVESPALTVKNPHTDVEMTARIYVTLKKNGVETSLKEAKRLDGGVVPTDVPLVLIDSKTMTKETAAVAKYDLVVTSFISVNNGDEVKIENTLSFERRNTFTQRFYEENGDLYYAVQKVNTGVNDLSPNNFRITITGETLENPKVVNANGYAYSTEAETVKNLTKDVMSTFEPGTYTVTIEAAKDKKLRSTVSYTYTIEEPPAFEPEFGTISTVLDNAAVPELTITNTHETLEMTTAIKATLKLNGELHPNVQNVSVGPEEAVAAGQTATLISTELLSKFATAKGNFEIVLTGTVTVDGVAYDVNKTISFSRIATFTHSLAVSDGNIIYTAKAESAEAEVFAPNGVKIYVEDAEGKTTIAGPTSQAVSVTVAGLQSSLNGVGIIKDLEPGTYTIKVEAYKNSELRGTATVQYTVAPKCEHTNVTNGDCTATIEVTCPDCKQTVTVKAGHTWGEYTYNNDATCVADGTKTASCTVDGCEAKDTVTAEGTKKETHTWGEYTYNNDATCVADGTKTASCTVDGCEAKDTVTAEGTKKETHTWGEYTYNNDATCVADGTKTASCTVDGCEAKDTVTAEGTKKETHTWGEYTYNNDATCVADGTKTASCTVDGCEAKDTVTAEGTKKETHTWGEYTYNNDATCVADGTKTASCTVDGCEAKDTVTAEGTKKETHTWGEYTYNNDATCVADGTKTASCTVDGCEAKDTVTAEGTKKETHTWGEYTYNNDATCVADGTKTASCTVDGCEAKDTVTAEGTKKETHTWGEYTYNNDATCVADGTKTASCTVDGCEAKDTVTAEGTKKETHTWGEYTYNNDATCVADGTKTASCTVDGCTAKDTVTAEGTKKETHTWGQYTYNEDATCVADGTKTASCTVDGCEAKDTVTAEGTKDPDAHKMELTTPEVPAQCGKAGTTAIYTCANGCDHTTGGEPIEALEHVYDNAEDNTCNLCGYVRAIDGGNLDLGNTMDYNVYVTLDPEKAEDAYAVIKKNGVVVEDDAKLEENGGSYEITLPGLAAKELCEGFTVEIYDKDGNKIGEAEESFAAYATRLFTKSSNEAAKRMIADMIVYATKAQQHFGYKTNDLLANQIDENLYKNYVTNYSEENVADRVVTQESKYYFGTNFELEKNISMNMFVQNIEGGYGEFSFTDGDGNVKYETYRIYADNEKMSGVFYIFNIDKFVTADGHDVTVTAKFYDANDNLVATVSDSMASYVARKNDEHQWLEYMMTFATSTYNYKLNANK